MYHQPVLLHESVAGLNIRPGGVYVDLTFGGGSHSRVILPRLGPEGRLIGFDQDEDALANAIDDERFILINQNFRYMKNFLRLYKMVPVDGILADLGISSHQIDEPARGFSTRFDGPLDMRMDRKQEVTASHIINTYQEASLKEMFSANGEVHNARQLAAVIVSGRKGKPLDLASFKEMIASCIPARNDYKYLAQVFQALRIEVNDELGALKAMLSQSLQVLKPGGRISIISYHSLEDRLVKNFLKCGNFEGEQVKDFFGNVETPFSMIMRKPVTPGEEELKQNPRSRSAKLRIAEKI